MKMSQFFLLASFIWGAKMTSPLVSTVAQTVTLALSVVCLVIEIRRGDK